MCEGQDTSSSGIRKLVQVNLASCRNVNDGASSHTALPQPHPNHKEKQLVLVLTTIYIPLDITGTFRTLALANPGLVDVCLHGCSQVGDGIVVGAKAQGQVMTSFCVRPTLDTLCPKLRILNMSLTAITPRSLGLLRHCAALELVNLRCCRNLSKQAVEHFRALARPGMVVHGFEMPKPQIATSQADAAKLDGKVFVSVDLRKVPRARTDSWASWPQFKGKPADLAAFIIPKLQPSAKVQIVSCFDNRGGAVSGTSGLSLNLHPAVSFQSMAPTARLVVDRDGLVV